jgi:hypothetical protein
MAKTPEAKLKAKLWELCKQITRKRYQLSDGNWNCFTCDAYLDEPAKAQTGHFIASSVCGVLLRYDLRNLRVQCYRCNINAGGNGAEYYRRLVLEKGQEYVNHLFEDKQKTIKAGRVFYETLISEYEEILNK